MRHSAYLNITKEEAEALDRKLHRNGFANRTEYFTACAHVTLYGKLSTGKKPLNPQIADWITNVGTTGRTAEKLQETFIELLHEIAFPVIAARGSEAALTLLAEDLRAAMFERTGTVPNPAEMEEWMQIFENIYRPELISFRAEQYRRSLTETTGGQA